MTKWLDVQTTEGPQIIDLSNWSMQDFDIAAERVLNFTSNNNGTADGTRTSLCVNALAGIPDDEIENVVKLGIESKAMGCSDLEHMPEWLRERMEQK